MQKIFIRHDGIDVSQRLRETMIDINFYNMEYLNELLNKLRCHFYEAYEHSYRVAIWTRAIANQCKMSEVDATKAYMGGLLHDIGKIRIPQSILTKNGTLSSEEYEQVKVHAREGYLLIKDYVPENIAFGVLMHHERLDGSGYPLQVKDNDISSYAKIIMIADAYDAMTVSRVYHPKMPWQDAIKELRKEPGKYDAYYLDALDKVIICRGSSQELKSG